MSQQQSHLNTPQFLARLKQKNPPDEAAWRDLYEHTHVQVHGASSKKLSSHRSYPGKIDDCVQETYLRAFTKIDGFRGDSKIETWLNSIAIKVTLNFLRGDNRINKFEPLLEDIFPDGWTDLFKDRGPSPLDTCSMEQLNGVVNAAIDNLPQNWQELIILFYWEGLKGKEIAEHLGVPEGTVTGELSKARKILKKQLQTHQEWIMEVLTR